MRTKPSTHRKGSKEWNLLPVSNLSIYTSNFSTSFRDKVSILRFREQINSSMLQKSAFLKVIIVKQPGVIINLVEACKGEKPTIFTLNHDYTRQWTHKCLSEWIPCNSTGMVPLKLLFLKSNTSSIASSPNSLGMVPEKWFWESMLTMKRKNQGSR